MRTPRTKPLVGSCEPAPLGLGFPGGLAHGTLQPASPALLGSVLKFPRSPLLRLCSPLLTPLPHLPTHPFSGHKGPFLFADPKEAGCQGDRSRNSRELAMGEGLCPQTAVSGSSPSWDYSICLFWEDMAPRGTHSLPYGPPLSHCRSPLVILPGGNEPASLKMLQ